MKLSFRGDTAASADFFPFLCLPMDMHCKADPFSAMHREYWSPAPSAALSPVPPSLPSSPCPAPPARVRAAPSAPPRAPGTRRPEKPRSAPGRSRRMRRYPSLLLFLSLSIAVPGAGAARDLSWIRNQIILFFLGIWWGLASISAVSGR